MTTGWKSSEYFVLSTINNSHAKWGINERIEEPIAQKARLKINRTIDETHKIMISSGTPPPALGGYVRQMDIVQNIFNLQGCDINPNLILDCIDRAIGIYERNHSDAFIRTINPFFYIGRLIELVTEPPFLVLAKLGLDRRKTESSTLGRMVKGILYLITVIAALLTILPLLDILEPVKEFIQLNFK